MRLLIIRLLKIADILILPVVLPSAIIFWGIRRAGLHRLAYTRELLLKVGVVPVRNHYYEPQFDYRSTTVDLSADRNLPGIDWNTLNQLSLLSELKFAHELIDIPWSKVHDSQFYFGNSSFGTGDSEYWYQIVRKIKPRRIIEIGSGNSTLMAIKAIQKNIFEDDSYRCEHICIEPYEMDWLEACTLKVIRKKVEDIDLKFFSQLQNNDILFIDSSHIIRPHGDVLYEYLELLPILNKGVIVHIHDIFSPKNYPRAWLQDEILFWNEQYLLEAFLTNNKDWKIIGALNYLHHHYYDELKKVAPHLTHEREPGSLYIQKIA